VDVVKYIPLNINVGDVRTDFQISGPTPQGCSVALNIGDTITCTFSIDRVAGRTSPGTVTLGLYNLDGSLRQSLGTANTNGSVSATISTTGMSRGLHTFYVRGTATNSAGDTVTHMYPFTISVNPQSAPGSDTYVDIIGYAALRIVCAVGASQCMPPNTVWAEAVTPVLSSLDDPTFDIVQPIRLIPWDY
jgi:hypothetical protein